MLARYYDPFNQFDGNLGFEDSISNPNRIDWNSIIQQGFAVGSQAINAWSGQNGGVQVGYNPAQGGVFAIQSNQPNQPVYQNPYANMTPEQVIALQRRQSGLAEDAAGGIMGFIEKYPIPIAGGVLALFLLMKEPPRRR